MGEKKEQFKVEIEKLINMYHSKQEALDGTSSNYKNRLQKQDALREIAE